MRGECRRAGRAPAVAAVPSGRKAKAHGNKLRDLFELVDAKRLCKPRLFLVVPAAPHAIPLLRRSFKYAGLVDEEDVCWAGAVAAISDARDLHCVASAILRAFLPRQRHNHAVGFLGDVIPREAHKLAGAR